MPTTRPSSTSPRAPRSSALDEFKDTDEVGLWVFSTDLGGEHPNWREVVPVGEIGANRDDIAAAIERQIPVQGTPLYEVTGVAYETMLEQYDPTMINAVVLLTDGVNDDGIPSDDDDQFTELIETLQAGSEGAELAAGARVHDLLRRVSRRDHAAGDQPGDERSHLQRQQSADHRASLHRRDLELLTMFRILATRGASSEAGAPRPPLGHGRIRLCRSDHFRLGAAAGRSNRKLDRTERASEASERVRSKFRDRFFTPKVAEAMMSPGGIVLAGVGAAVTILAGAPLIAAAGVGALAWGGRVLAAVGRNPATPQPHALSEPWRGYAQSAQDAKRRFDQIVASVPDGPLRSRLATLSGRLDDGVDESWRIAKRGHEIVEALGTNRHHRRRGRARRAGSRRGQRERLTSGDDRVAPRLNWLPPSACRRSPHGVGIDSGCSTLASTS